MMRRVVRLRSWHIAAVAVILTGIVAGVGAGDNEDGSDGGAVFTLTNEPDGNRLVVYEREGGGQLSPRPHFVSTGGAGTGEGLGSQGALALSDNGNFLYAVNPGSDTITVFHLSRRGPRSVQVIGSQGQRPISLTTSGNRLFVLNNGGAVNGVDNIAGFVIGANGRLYPIPDSTRLLSAQNTDPAQIGFNRDGNVLVVTEKDTNLLTSFSVNRQGIPSEPGFQASAGATPFGFAFSRDGFLLVSEAFGGAPDASAVSSYTVGDTGALTAISPSVGTMETAACWVAITRNGAFAYTANTGSDTISGYAIDKGGDLSLLDADGVAAETGGAPTDLAILGNRALFVLNSSDATLSVYAIDKGGALQPLQVVGGLPLTGPTGLVVR
jgi:6-phosphogluconolactonase (cycloisomerase 2 family)